jgi:hypothetical protein
MFVKYKENIIKYFCIYILNLGYVIRFFIMIFNKLEKDGTVDLRFRGIQNILSDREPRGRPRNKVLRSGEQKTVPKPPGQFEDHNTNLTESAPEASDYSLKPPCTRPTVSVEVPKKSVTWNDLEIVVIKSNEDIDKLDLGQTDTESAPESALES